MAKQDWYVAIDLKSFYASAECVLRNLDPLTTNLVVADASRTEKTICLAVSPSLKAYGIPGRARLFEVVEKVKLLNAERRMKAPGHKLDRTSWDDTAVRRDAGTALDYIVAPPQMRWYMEFSARIFSIYLRYVAPEHIHPYSIDEVFIYATPYLGMLGLDAPGFARMLMAQVLKETGITATAGVGTNLYLAKIAMDIVAKHAEPDAHGARMGVLTEMDYRKLLWNHRPLTDFWRIGRGTAKKLERYGMYTMGDVARCSLGKDHELHNESLLYKLFGVNAELIIDHAWGYEPCRMEHIKAYKPQNNSLSSGQVLTCPYTFEKAKLVLREMADEMALDLVSKGLLTNQITVTVGYDVENLLDPLRRAAYSGDIVTDFYGREVPKHGHGSHNFAFPTASGKELIAGALEIFDRTADKSLLVRRMTISAAIAKPEKTREYTQLDLFSDDTVTRAREEAVARERKRQQAVLQIKARFGKNAILKGCDLQEGATIRERNAQIGGHKA